MKTYLLTWNPRRWPWKDLAEVAGDLHSGKPGVRRWSTRSRKIQPGDRLFMLRQGLEPRGIFASGNADGPIVLEPSWNPDAAEPMASYIPIRFEVLLNPDKEPILARAELDEAPFHQFHWNTQASGIEIRDDIAAALEVRWRAFLDSHALAGGGHAP